MPPGTKIWCPLPRGRVCWYRRRLQVEPESTRSTCFARLRPGGAGRRAEALREAGWLERFDDYPGNRASRGTGYDPAAIMAQLGETGKALGEIEQLLARPGVFSVHELRLNTDFDPIRNDPRYLALLRKYANPGT
jgi:hypothetical protein